MKITFFGAAHEVTGSCHLVEVGNKKILLDCGMFQGADSNEDRNHEDFPFDPSDIDAVLLSHAHLDHTGRVPKLIKDGFKGKIYATKATCELAQIVWADAERIMVYNHRKYQTPVLYTEKDVLTAGAKCKGLDYGEKVDLGDGVSAIFKDAGHIFGASFIELSGEGKTLGFSGDIGNVEVPILRETEQLGEVDALICESTYGDRLHEGIDRRKEIILDTIKEAYERGGAIMVPAFSLERTQEFLYELDEMVEEDQTLPKFPIFLDSPMAIDALPTYKKYPEYYDEEAMKKYKKGNDFLDFPQLTITRTVEESKQINDAIGPKMVIAGAGMMNGGRILHHLRRHLSDPNSTLIIVGYQAKGTLGRQLYDGEKNVKIFQDNIPVNCVIKTIRSLSAHGDQKKIISWISGAKKIPEKVYCVHGEVSSATALADKLNEYLSLKATVPEYGETVEI